MGVAHVPLQGAAAEKAVPFPIDMLDAAGELQEHLARVEDYILAEVVWREAIARWPGATIICGRVGENAPARCEKKVGNAALCPEDLGSVRCTPIVTARVLSTIVF
jgi:hypothetical protein